MRIELETFARVNIVKIFDQAGTPIKILFDGGDGGIVGITAGGQIVHAPGGPGDPASDVSAQTVEYMRQVRELVSSSATMLLTPCEVIASRIVQVEEEMRDPQAHDTTMAALEQRINTLTEQSRIEGCSSTGSTGKVPKP